MIRPLSRRALALAATTTAAVLAVAGPAAAWDCIRVSSSQQGLMKSAGSGNWAYLTIDDLVAGGVASGDVPASAVGCVLDAWHQLGEPSYFAIGAGVAGAHGATQSGHISDQDFFELAKNAPAKVMVNGQGVDHLDDALMILVQQCDLPAPSGS